MQNKEITSKLLTTLHWIVALPLGPIMNKGLIYIKNIDNFRQNQQNPTFLVQMVAFYYEQ